MAGEKDGIYNQCSWDKWKMINSGLLPYPQKIRDLNVKTDILVLAWNMSEFMYNLDVDKAFLTINQNPVATFKEMNKSYYIKEKVCNLKWCQKILKFGRKQLQYI